MSLIGDEVQVSRRRHRAAATAAEKIRAAAGAAVAAGAVIGTASQIAPAIAYASPLLPGGGEDAVEAEPAPPAPQAVQPAEQMAEAAPVAAPSPAPVQAAEIAAPAPAPVAAPFGLNNLPPEVAAPLAHAEQTLKQLHQQFAPAPVVRPVAGAVSSGYGSRWGTTHHGIDFADTLGAPIKSVADGTVIEAGPASGFGLWVRVLHDDGTTGVYGHVNDMYVTQGQRVKAGDVIATVGNRGNSTGPHLHLEIWDQNGNKVDPMNWMISKGVPLEWGPSH
ncbi:M23 family metallopeptidase [Nocardia sp. NPDC019395]|uniref:M23 family metallopeptidase n=1 Tax=Nocardia sp. NPDC019395 TaxID=3154686 RepID=UPI0033FF39A5